MIYAPAVLQARSPQAERVRALNGELLRKHAELQRAGSSRLAALLRDEAGPIIARRAEALSVLIRQDPGEALALGFPQELSAALAAAFPQSASRIESHGAWEGPVETVVEDGPDMQSHRVLHYLRIGNRTVEVHVAGVEPDTKCHDIVKFEGVQIEGLMAASSASVTTSDITAALPCGPTGEQRVAVLMVTFPGVTPPSGVTATGVHDIVAGISGRSIDSFWREASYGKAWATADVYGWYTLDAAYTCDQTTEMRAAAIRAADADVNFQNYTRIWILFPAPSGCSFAGRASVGCASLSSTGDGSFSAGYAYMLSSYFSTHDQGVKLALHEGGHNLGLMHSRSRDFGAEALGALGVSGTLSEYADVQSGMGSWNFGHYTGSQKLKLGWQLDGSNVLTVQSPGMYSLQPTEVNAAGLQTLKVQRGTGNNAWLWLEYRQPIGSYDSTLNSQIFTGALVHYQDSITGSYTDLLDHTPGTSAFTDAALAAGQTWVDPYTNVSLYVQSATSNALTVSVNYGALPCTQSNPTVSASPLNASAYAGNSVNYTASVTNNDSAGCSAGTFTIGSDLPSGWSTVFSASSLTLSPGQSASVTMTKTVPAGTLPATYAVNASASRASSSGTGNANVTVMAPLPPLYVTPTVGSSYAPRSLVPMTATVLSGADPAAGASVLFTLTKPGGGITTKNATTDSSGKAAWSYRLGPKDLKGTYSLTVKATSESRTATGGPVTFTVQ